MTRHPIHSYACKLVFGRLFPQVDRALDAPAAFLGKGHRRLFHTCHEAFVLGSIISPDGGGAAGVFHVLVDNLCSRDKNFKKFLEFSAWQDREWRKEKRYWKK